VAAALERAGFPLAVEPIACAPRVRGALRPVARWAFARVPDAAALPLARRLARFDPPAGRPDLILSSGGGTAFASAGLARALGAPNAFVGNPRPFPGGWFRAVLSPVALPDCAGAPVIETAVVPSLVTPARCAEAARARWPEAPAGRRRALLVGGDSRNHRFAPEDFAALAEGVNALARRDGVRWLVTTSRRTGAAGERILADRLAPDAVAELTLFGRSPDPVVLAYMGAAEAVAVTQDSLTMLSEAIASGRPVTALAPAEVTLDPANFMARVLDRFAALPQFSRLPCARFAEAAPPVPGEAPFDAAERALAEAARRLAASVWPAR
jgi:mitochondrial fission protein ELM1